MIRKATLKDVDAIKSIISFYAKQELMLHRSVSDLYESIRNFYVYDIDGDVVGCCGLQVLWSDLAEVLSFAILPEYKGKGIDYKQLDPYYEWCKENKHTEFLGLFFHKD